MTEETPSGSGFHQTPETVERLLSAVREALEMEVAFVSEFAEDRLVFRALEGDAESFGWREGESFPLDASFLFHCQAHLDVAMDDHVFQTGASPQRLPGFFCLPSYEVERARLTRGGEDPQAHQQAAHQQSNTNQPEERVRHRP